MTKNKIKINDIAKKTGLSISTVSRVLNGKGEQYRIGEKSQLKIQQVAKELNYIPNQFAASLKSGKSKTVALIIPSLSNPFFAGITGKINTEIRKYGYTTIIGDSDENIDIEREEISKQMSRNIEGVIIVPCGDKWDHLIELQDQGMPIVCVDRYFEDMNIPYVSTDNYYGAYEAAKYLIENGHRSIACIQGLSKSTPNKLRLEGFMAAMKEFDISNYKVVGDDFSVQNGYLETKLLLQQEKRPTAIFSFSNTIAMGTLKALKEEKVSMPNDISLITFDYNPYQEFLSAPLSCVAQAVDDISKIAVKFLFSRIEDKNKSQQKILLKPQLMYRESVKRII